MKKTLLFMAAVLLLFAAVSCSEKEVVSKTALLQLAVDTKATKGLEVGKTTITDVVYKATLTQTDGTRYIKYDGQVKSSGEEFALSGTSSAIELSYGEWTLVVNGYDGENKMVYTSTPDTTSPTDITFTVSSSRIGSLTTVGVGATVDEGSNTLKVSVRNIKTGNVTVTRADDAAIIGVSGAYDLKWSVSTDYVTFSDWTSSTVFNAGTTYWVRCNAVDKTNSTLVYATATTAAFSLYYGEKANISGSLDPNTGAFKLEIDSAVVNAYTVTFLSNGGSAVEAKTGISKGSKITAPEEPTKDDCSFGGWYKDPALSEAWNFESDKVNQDTILYAKWTEATISWFDSTAAGKYSTDVKSITFSTSAPSAYDSSWTAPCNTTAYFTSSTDSLYYVPKSGSSIVMTDSNRISFGRPAWDTMYQILMERVNETYGKSYTDVEEFKDDMGNLYAEIGEGLFVLYQSVMAEQMNFINVESIEGLELLDVSRVTDFSYMFYCVIELTSLDLHTWDVSNGVDFSYMLANDEDDDDQLETINISGWNLAHAESLYGLFSDRYRLTSIIGLNDLVVSNVADLSYVFDECTGFETLDISSWNTSGATTVKGMFYGCENLETLKVGANFKVDNCTDISYLFMDCSSLETCYFNGVSGDLDVIISTFNTSKVTKMLCVFRGTNKATFDLRSWNVDKVTDMSYLFAYASLESVNISTWNTSNVTNMGSLFQQCESLTTITIGDGFNTSKVTNMEYMFYGCDALVDYSIVKRFDVSKATTMEKMFANDTGTGNSLVLDIRSWNTASLENISEMFCFSSIQTIVFGTGFVIPESAEGYLTSFGSGIDIVYYTGTEEQWNASGIGAKSNKLIGSSTTKCFNYTD